MNDVDVESPEMRDIWANLQRSDDPDEREYLLARLANIALEHHDFSDPEVSEGTHSQFEMLRHSRERHHAAAVRVGRLVARMMASHDVPSNTKTHAGETSN